MKVTEPIVVIGSNSFSGASFIRYCLCKGSNVIGISRSPEPNAAFLPYKWQAGVDGDPGQGSFSFYELDLNLHTQEIADIVQKRKVPFVVNFAAQGMVAQSWDNPLDWYRTNVLGNVGLHERLRRFDFLKRYVHVSTPEVYGSTAGVIDEDTAFNPTTPYAASRATCDLHLRTFFKRYEFPVVFTRAANVYGPGQQLYRIIPRTMLFIRLGKILQLHGGGRSTRAFIHIQDVADATWRIAHKGTSGETYHISTGQYVSVRELIEKICQYMNVRFEDTVEMAPERPGKDDAYLLDSGKMRSQLQWDAHISLEEGLRETLNWVDANLDNLKSQPFDYIHKP